MVNELQSMRQNWLQGTTWDSTPMLNASLSEMDTAAFQSAFQLKANQVQEKLISLELVAKNNSTLFPTRAGMLTFGLNRLKYFPDAWIAIARFTGNDRSEFEQVTEIKGMEGSSYRMLPRPELIESSFLLGITL